MSLHAPEDCASVPAKQKKISDKVSELTDPEKRKKKKKKKKQECVGRVDRRLTAFCRHSLSSISLLLLCSFRSVFAFPAVGK